MHQTRQSLRLAGSTVRNVSTAAKIAPRSLGKWALPENPTISPASSSSRIDSTSETSSRSNFTRSRDWQSLAPTRKKRQDDRPYRSGSSSSQTWSSRQESFKDDLVTKSMNLPSKNSSYSARQNTHQMGSTSRSTERGTAPYLPPPRNTSSSGPSPVREILRKAKNRDIPEEEVKVQDTQEAPSEIYVPESAELYDIAEDIDVASQSRERKLKHLRANSKEQQESHFLRYEFDKKGKRTATRQPSAAASAKSTQKQPKKAVKQVPLDVYIPSAVSVRNLAKLLKVRLDNLQRKMVFAGMEEQTSYDHILTSEWASLLAMEFNRNPVINDEAAFDIYPPPPHPDPSTLPSRPPIVTIMGHVDHGKTTLLDTLRSASVAQGEAGGITQHIGAFSVPVPASSSSGSGDVKTITFLDTPGHAAFSAMRARGAGVTDIAVVVVAADDGIMPQTKEVLELLKKEEVSFLVAVNKVDKPGADVEAVQLSLLAEGVQLETFRGDVPCVPVSGLTGQGLDQLVETISAMAEMQDLRAERDGKIQGYALESKVHKGLGSVATVLLLRGCLKPGDHLICGTAHAKVRLLSDASGASLRAAYPGMAVTVSGWKELPKAGEEVLQGPEAEVKKALANRIRQAEIDSSMEDIEVLNEQRRTEREQKDSSENEQGAHASDKQNEGPKQLRLVIKGDVSGSVEAIAGALEGIGNHMAGVNIIATGVGDVNESDIMRAKAVDGVVVAFSVNVSRPIRSLASSQQVQILASDVIYRLMDDVKTHVIALLPPIIEQRVTGEATVLQLFDINVKGRKTARIAGCRVTYGSVEKNKRARVVRNGKVVHEGNLETLRHHKDDIDQAKKGTECGVRFVKYEDIREGDLIQLCEDIEKPATL